MRTSHEVSFLPMIAANIYSGRIPQGDFHPLHEIAFVEPHPLRKCRISRFGARLCEALCDEYPQLACTVVALNDGSGDEGADAQVRHVIRNQSGGAYRLAARFLNQSDADVVCLQHSNDILDGPRGARLLEFLDELTKPLVTTLHAVDPDPTPEEQRVMNALFKSSHRLVTMTLAARDLLRESYDVPLKKIEVIPYGVTDAPVLPSNPCKEAVGLEGRSVLLTSGYLAPGRGLEHVIHALPAVIRQYPDLVYVIVGATRPGVLETDGEAYRHSLEEMARACGVSEHVLFVDRFVADDELDLYISAADICLTPYEVECRTSSAMLSRLVGMGKAVISTPYRHAREILAEGRGRLVRFASPMALATSILDLLNDSSTATSIRQRAWAHGRSMVWPKIAQAYMDCFQSAANPTQGRQVEADAFAYSAG